MSEARIVNKISFKNLASNVPSLINQIDQTNLELNHKAKQFYCKNHNLPFIFIKYNTVTKAYIHLISQSNFSSYFHVEYMT